MHSDVYSFVTITCNWGEKTRSGLGWKKKLATIRVIIKQDAAILT